MSDPGPNQAPNEQQAPLPRRSRRRLMLLAMAFLLALPLLGRSYIIRQLGGAFRYQPEQLATGLSPQAKALLDRAFTGLNGAPYDYHNHVVGLGKGGTGVEINDRLKSWRHPVDRTKFLLYYSASGIKDESKADAQYMDRLRRLAQGFPKPGRHLLLAFDHHYNPDGTVNHEKSEFYVPNAYVFKLAAAHPEVFEPAMSVHPYRKDALQALEKWAGKGGKVIKWLPNAMGIDPASPRCDAFYEKVRALNLVILSHAGEEQAVEAEEDQELGNPLRLRRPLDRGVKIIVAHCASLGSNDDLDHPGQRETSFRLFLRLMDTARYRGLLWGEISAMTQFNRIGEPLTTLLARPDLHPRLVNGSDYPLPALSIVIRTGRLQSLGYINSDERAALNDIYDYNPLLFDFAVKRCLKHPKTGASFSPAIFTRRPAQLTRR